jgi:diguanylate cyclase (GGDEF)-like protein/putative nucleotidyltransferase with HDIG domain
MSEHGNDQQRSETPARVPTILIIDDDPVINFLLRSFLEKAGYRCLVARDGDGAWQVLSPDVSLVLLDIMMPGQNGPEILRRMRLDPMLADIPVIFVTGRTDAATRIQCLAMGAVGFVVKPFHAKDVLSQVSQALDRTAVDEVSDGDDVDPLEAALETELAPTSGLGGDLSPSDLDSMPVSQLLRSLLAERRGTRRSLASHRRLVSALFRLHQAMSEGENPRALAQSVVGLAQKALRATRAEIWLPSDDALQRFAALPGERDDGAAAAVVIPLDGVEPAAQVWRDWLTVERGEGTTEIDVHYPLTVGTDRIGVMSLWFPAANRPSESLSSFFCAEVALALDSSIRLERAQSEALTDALTGAYNRRFLEACLAEELRRAGKLGYPTSLMFLDLDKFKEVNDNYGHDVGDQLLRNVATLLRSELRSVDVVARFGGDEFVVVLPETDRAGSLRVALRLQEALARRGLEGMPEGCDVTFTIGTATSPEDGLRPSDLLVSADSAMLRGKRSGRNRIEMFGEEAAPVPVYEAPRREETAVLRTLIAALEVRDRYTARHSREVGALSARIARHMGCAAEQVRECGQAGLLHDIGKLHTPLEILLKPGPLDENERLIMNLHAEVGADLAHALAPVRHLSPAIRASQEFFDGTGYPDGIAGNAIPVAARIIAVADAFHAMCSDRPYRAALPREVAAAELRRCAGTQFDPVVVEALLDLVSEDDVARERVISSAA